MLDPSGDARGADNGFCIIHLLRERPNGKHGWGSHRDIETDRLMKRRPILRGKADVDARWLASISDEGQRANDFAGEHSTPSHGYSAKGQDEDSVQKKRGHLL